MNKKLLLGGLALLVLIGGVAAYFSQKHATQTAVQAALMQKEQSPLDTGTGDVMTKTDGALMTDTGTYETYAVEKIAMASSTHKVVLFFHASWCPTCRAIDADIKSHLKDIPKDLTILNVDYDTSSALKMKYGVTTQHTFVEVDAQGVLIKKWRGSPTLAALVEQLQ